LGEDSAPSWRTLEVVGEGSVTLDRRIAGRLEEQRLLGAAIESAGEGEPCAFFVHGEAGAGKTHLVEAVCGQASGDGFAVLWGRCVRFGSVDSPYLPFVNALAGWLEAAKPTKRSEILDTVDGVGELLPSLRRRASDRPVRLLAVVDGLVSAIAASGPTILVVDDVQWADPASRDALAYLIAGFRRQRLLLLATLRDEELVAGDPTHGWLADLRRLPSVHELRLGRLTRDETEQQITQLVGGEPRPHLVDAVLGLTGGNAYFTELLVTKLTPDDDQLPDGLPSALRQALMAAWHGLTATAREVVRLLAVAGRPSRVDQLATVAADRGIGAESVTAALAEASDRGIVVPQGTDQCWLRHPLLAEVLYGTFVPGEAASTHASWAKVLETAGAGSGDIDELRRQADLARHYEGSHQLAACFDASLRAADLAQHARALREAAGHLRRAARLWPATSEHGAAAGINEADLLERVARASALVGDSDANLAALSRALALVDVDTDPLRVSRLLADWSEASRQTDSIEGGTLAEVRRAVELARPYPDSTEYAEALAQLSTVEFWSNKVSAAQEHAEQALRAARRTGDNKALSVAYTAHGETFVREERSGHATKEALRYARLSDDPNTTGWAFVGRANYLADRGRLAEAVENETEALRFAIEAGALAFAAFQAACLARDLLALGRVADSRLVVREGLSYTGMPNAGAMVRVSAALLSVRIGDLDVAQMHLERAKELIPTLEHRRWLMAPPVMVEYLLARRKPQAALDLLSRTFTDHAVDPYFSGEMLTWGARAAADLAEMARDRHDTTRLKTAQAALNELVTSHSKLPHSPFEQLVAEDKWQPAWEALFQAETQRCMAQAPTSDAWRTASLRCEAAGMRWDQAIASWRWAQALLAEEADRTAVAVPLRSAHRYATEGETVPLLRNIEALAAIGRIPLAEPAPSARPETRPAPFNTLTKREHEVLSHLVVGRTYNEIAKALFISEKTVSVHVSNLLRKTGTNSRHEVSALALRTRQTPTRPD
jgi:DNA-binding CsgD family transcriptional regulator